MLLQDSKCNWSTALSLLVIIVKFSVTVECVVYHNWTNKQNISMDMSKFRSKNCYPRTYYGASLAL